MTSRYRELTVFVSLVGSVLKFCVEFWEMHVATDIESRESYTSGYFI